MAYGMAYGNGKFVASSTNGRLYTSDDTGQTWSYIVPDIDGLSPANNDKYLNIVYNGEMFIAVIVGMMMKAETCTRILLQPQQME